MKAPGPEARAARLTHLLQEYSHPERRNLDLLAEIGRLLDDAAREGALAPGSTPDEIRRTLGPPFLCRGDESQASFTWGYPQPAPACQAAGEDWYLFLRFEKGRLRALESRIWREAR